MTDLPRRRFALDHTVRSDLARRLLELVAEQWARSGATPAAARVVRGVYARILRSDPTSVGRALDRLRDTRWVVIRRAPDGARLVSPGPACTDGPCTAADKAVRPRTGAA